MAAIAEGGCACGAIRYRVEGHPTNSMVCHCQTCRRVSASPVVAWVTFPKDRFSLVTCTPSEYQSSIDITPCSLDDPDAFPPTHHSWLSHDLAWVRFGDRLPSYAEWRT